MYVYRRVVCRQVLNSYEMLAFAVIDSKENKDHWLWFFRCFYEAYGQEVCRAHPVCCLVSDRDKGLNSGDVAAFLTEHHPQLHHMWCVVHLISNVIKHLKDK